MSKLPLYRHALDWDAFEAKYPAPDDFEKTNWRWSSDEFAAHQNREFLATMERGWANPFYQRLWGDKGIAPGDVRSIEDIHLLPTFTSDDLKNDQQKNPPFGLLANIAEPGAFIAAGPLKLQTSGGTTGKPRRTIQGVMEWEICGLGAARALYLQGARPGDIMQIPRTTSLAMVAWSYYKACHDYLGVMPLTTGSGLVTSSRQQVEIAKDIGTTLWTGNAQYLIRLAKVCQEEFGHPATELGARFLSTFLGPDTEGLLRKELEDLWGCVVYDNYGTNEIGLGASECAERKGMHFAEDTNLFEILDRDTGKRLPDGEVGNIVVTNFTRTMQPLIRYNLRDLTRVIHSDRCACGSCFRRMDHFLGRSDSMVKIRGVNVYPLACLSAVRSDPRTTGEWLCEALNVMVDGKPSEELRVHVEIRQDAAATQDLKDYLGTRLHDDLGLRVQVELVPAGSLDSNVTLGEGKATRLVDRRKAYQ